MKQENLVNENLMHENRRRQQYDYQPLKKVLKKNTNPHKLGEWTSGPYVIEQVHMNGTITIKLNNNTTE
jgi:hypothetical protein